MATWEDGPEYAPVERPAEFEAPEVAPLDDAPPRVRIADAPDVRPDFGLPERAVPALEFLAAAPAALSRNPIEPFAVARAAITDQTSAWSAAHTAPHGPASGDVPPGTWAAPTGPPAGTAAPVGLGSGQRVSTRPAPTLPIALSGARARDPIMPQPGSPEWFGPGPGAPDAPARRAVTAAEAVAALSPVVLIFLLIGGLIQPMAAVAFIVAFSCSRLIKVARRIIQMVFTGAAVVVALVTLVSMLLPRPQFFATLNQMSQLACWLVLVSAAVLVVRGLRRGDQEPPPPGAWG